MKKIILLLITISLCKLSAQVGAFQVRRQNTSDAAIMLGYNDYRYLTFGKASANPNNGAWSIEHWNSGLNFWRPWNTWNSGNYKMFISDGGFVGINMRPMDWYTQSVPVSSNAWWLRRTISNFRLQIEGNAISHGWYTWSDVSIKTNIENLPTVLTKVLALEPKMYNYIKERSNSDVPITDSIDIKDSTIKADLHLPVPTENEPKHYGLIAQDVKVQFPNIVGTVKENLEAINYVELVPILIKAIQEQQQTIQDLRQEIINWQGRSIDTIGQSRSRLFQNTPNPFDGTTTITYFIDETTAVTSAIIEVRNIMGVLQSTITLSDGTGLGSVLYNGSNLTQGYYIYTLKINGSVKDSKMFLKEQ